MPSLPIDNTVIIVGDSPFLKEVEKEINYVTERYFSIGINRAVKKYKVHAHAFVDIDNIPTTNHYSKVKTISLQQWGDLISKEDKELIDTFTFDGKNFRKDNKLAWCGFTHDYVISYCLFKKFKNIILIGAADFSNGSHYSSTREFSYSEKFKENSKGFIEKFCTKYASIKTCNPNSILRVPKISIMELLTNV